MTPDDPRHGTTAGHNAGCRCTPCRAAKLRYDKRRRHEAANGHHRLVPVLGAQRRIRALQALGYSVPAIADATGVSVRNLHNAAFRVAAIRPDHHAAIAAGYEALCMRPAPDTWYAARSRRAAAAKGWAPPLAWDDIDDPNETPTLACVHDGCLRPAVAPGGPCFGHARKDRGAPPARREWKEAELLDEYDHLRSCGVSDHAACTQLGVHPEAVAQARRRTEKRATAA